MFKNKSLPRLFSLPLLILCSGLFFAACSVPTPVAKVAAVESNEGLEEETGPRNCRHVDLGYNHNDVSLTIINNTSIDYLINTSDVSCYDFSDSFTPEQMNGLNLPAGATSETYLLAARRVCPWITHLNIPFYNGQSANWTTSITSASTPSDTASFTSTISCERVRTTASLCKGGFFQDKTSFPLVIGNGMLRVSIKCESNGDAVATLSTVY